MHNLIKNCEIEYTKSFSTYIDEVNIIRFRDNNIPDMYYHNFTLIKDILTDEALNDLIIEEKKLERHENKGYIQLESNFSINDKAFCSDEIKPTISKYYYMSIPTSHHRFLKAKEQCDVKEAITDEIMKDGIRVDILANSAAMGEEFATKRIHRKVQIYNSSEDLRFFVCYNNGTPVGNCELFIKDNVAKIEDFDILEKYQRNGFGTAVLKHLLQQAEQLGAEIAYVVTDSEDTAQDMYVKCGFTLIGEKFPIFFDLTKKTLLF
ncbi:MAG TPA: GNAT family N-acetyltransferase [Ruminiclostridium sp.]